jgi:hypothetical protein
VTASAWTAIADLATALGTLILAVATFSAVRSSNMMAKVAQEQLLIQIRPVLTTSRREDPVLKVNRPARPTVTLQPPHRESPVWFGDF